MCTVLAAAEQGDSGDCIHGRDVVPADAVAHDAISARHRIQGEEIAQGVALVVNATAIWCGRQLARPAYGIRQAPIVGRYGFTGQ